MSSTPAKLLVFTSDQLACVKIQGKANLLTSIEFKSLLNEILDRKFSCLVLDLSECTLMDSTFLGVLAGYGMKLHQNPMEGLPAGIELLGPTQRILDLLEGLGVIHLFNVLTTNPADGSVEGMVFTEKHSAIEPTKEEVAINCLEAHKLLMEMNPSNVNKFKDVTAFLAENLKRIQSGQ